MTPASAFRELLCFFLVVGAVLCPAVGFPHWPPSSDILHRLVVEPGEPARSLPSRVVNIEHLPTVRAQGLNNCGAFAPSYFYKTWQEARERGWNRPDPDTHPERIMSPGFVYPLSNAGRDEGANVRFVMEVMVRHGIATWADMPESHHYTVYPNEDQWRAALPHRAAGIVGFDASTPAGIEALKEHLAGGDLAVMTLMLYHDTHPHYPDEATPGVSNGVLYGNGEHQWQEHAFVLIGYDDAKSWTEDGQHRQGAFLVVNTWGPEWGVALAEAGSAGFAWVSYDYVANEPALHGRPSVVLAMEDRIGYEPVETALVDLSISSRSNFTMGIHAGSPANPQSPILTSRLNGGGDLPYTGRVVLDLTDILDEDAVSYTFTGFDVSHHFGTPAGEQTGSVREFHVVKESGIVIESAASQHSPTPIRAGVQTTVFAGPFLPLGAGLDDWEHVALSIASADWNRDGRPGFAVAGGAVIGNPMLKLLWSTGADGGGRLVEASGELPHFEDAALAWGDLNNSGLPDLVVFGREGFTPLPGRVFLNKGAGGFVDSGQVLPAVGSASLSLGDYTNNGWLDLAFAGRDINGDPIARVWQNAGEGFLMESGILLHGEANATVTWVDVDNNGWLDLAIGHRIHRNNGDGTFTLAATLGEHAASVNHAWGDFTANGFPDVATGGFDSSPSHPSPVRSTRLFRNHGSFLFEEVPHDIVPLEGGAFAWGDFDNDGRLDLLVSGYPVEDWSETTTRILRQQPDGSFRDTGADLLGVARSSVLLEDLTGNGFLDIVLSGHHDLDPDVGRFRGRTAAFANTFRSPAGANEPPSAPERLRAFWNGGGSVVLRWGDAFDAETPGQSLAYRVRVGTFPGGWDVASPATDAHHLQRVGEAPGRLLTGLAMGRYYWSVQTIDGGRAAGEWSPEATFLLGGFGLFDEDPNGDGILDVADMLHGALGDQYLSHYIAGRILGTVSPPFLSTVDEQVIDGWGGSLASESAGFELHIPAGSFQRPARLKLSAGQTPGVPGPAVVPFSWRVDGLPIDHHFPLNIRLRDLRPNREEEEPWVLVGFEAHAPSLGEDAISYVAIEAESTPDGWLEFTLPEMPPLEPWEEEKQRSLTGRDISAYEYWTVLHIFAETQIGFRGGNFFIIGPREIRDELPHIASDLEEQLQYYRETIGFDTSRRNWVDHPVRVTIQNLGLGGNGEPVAGYMVSAMSYNRLAIQLNSLGIRNRERARATTAHELFHVMQGLYDSRNRVARATTSPNLWLDEATSTYFESPFSPNPNKATDLTSAYAAMALGGNAQARALSMTTRQNYGYSLATLIHFLVQENKNDPAIIHDIYQRINQGTAGVHALVESISSPTSLWVPKYFGALLSEDIITGALGWPVIIKDHIQPRGRSRDLNSIRSRAQRFPISRTLPFSASYYLLYVQSQFPPPAPEDRMGFLLSSDTISDLDLAVISRRRVNNQFRFHHLGHATPTGRSGRLRLDLDSAAQLLPPATRVFPIITNFDVISMGSAGIPAILDFGIYQDYQDRTITAHQTDFNTVRLEGVDTGWPIFTGSGRFTAYDVTELVENYTSTGGAIPTIRIRQWGEPEPVSFQFSVTPNNQQTTANLPSGPVTLSIPPDSPIEYRLHKTIYSSVGGALIHLGTEFTPWTTSTNFTMGFQEDERILLTTVNFRYSYQIDSTGPTHQRTGTAFSIINTLP